MISAKLPFSLLLGVRLRPDHRQDVHAHALQTRVPSQSILHGTLGSLDG